MANENLQNALEHAGLTLEAFAEVIQVDPKSAQRSVTGNTVPYPRHRKAISRALNLEEHELWPGHTAAPEPSPDADAADRRCDVVGSWAYADDETAPDLALFITDSEGPIDVLDSHCGIELTDRLAAQAGAGRPVRVLAGTPTEQLRILIGQQGLEIRLTEIWMEFWFIRAGEQMLFAINFQDDVRRFPPPMLEVTGTITGGLFDRACNKFEELWQQADEDPETLLTQGQLDETLAYVNARDGHAVDQRPPPDNNSSAAPLSASPGSAAAPSPSVEAGEPVAWQRRRWPGRTD